MGGMAGIGLSLVSTGLGAYSSYKEASAANKAAEWNAQQAEANAAQARTRGAFDLSLLQKEHKQGLSSLAQGLTNAGVENSGGTALKLLAEQRGMDERAQQVQKYNTEMEAYGHELNASMQRSQKKSPWLNAFTSLLGGATNTYNQYSQYKMYTKAKTANGSSGCYL